MLRKLRKFALIVLGTYFGLAIVVIGFFTLAGVPTYGTAGISLLWAGIVVLILSVVFIGSLRGNRWSGAANGPRFRNEATFNEWRIRERPTEFVAWAVVTAAILVSVTGYVILHYSTH
ncbi:MAG: hypothetical protein CVU44_03235 [Chloroflexi bacterium HGW-Chloroflexi-6]|nr:MAG: hypothetical protein CVU44_03235 [Chloroflexi bacterium HGW-Chloroflexi-6]